MATVNYLERARKAETSALPSETVSAGKEVKQITLGGANGSSERVCVGSGNWCLEGVHESLLTACTSDGPTGDAEVDGPCGGSQLLTCCIGSELGWGQGSRPERLSGSRRGKGLAHSLLSLSSLACWVKMGNVFTAGRERERWRSLQMLGRGTRESELRGAREPEKGNGAERKAEE